MNENVVCHTGSGPLLWHPHLDDVFLENSIPVPMLPRTDLFPVILTRGSRDLGWLKKRWKKWWEINGSRHLSVCSVSKKVRDYDPYCVSDSDEEPGNVGAGLSGPCFSVCFVFQTLSTKTAQSRWSGELSAGEGDFLPVPPWLIQTH